MRHSSTLMLNSPIEVIESTQISPFISKVLIKVCYVGDEPNRNYSIISKETAREMGPTLRGCPIVGFYNDKSEDFEEHNRQINISNGEWHITDTTTPYGFVPTDAKVWFATYLDDGSVEREYLCTEGYLWDHAYPEVGRVLTKGNNQSMELDNDTLKGTWSKPENDGPSFFIINEALISKLCILGDESEPCFEGSQITAFSLKIEDSFQAKMYAMMSEIKEILLKGGATVTVYAVEIGDSLWSALYGYIEKTYPDPEHTWCSEYSIDGIYEENGQKFAVLRDKTMKYWRLDFLLSDTDGFQATGNLVEVTKTYQPTSGGQFSTEAVDAFVANYVQQKKDEEEKKKDKTEQENNKKPEDKTEDKSETSEDEKKEKAKKFSYDTLEEIPEYLDLQTRYAALQEKVASLTAEVTSLQRASKETKIAEFYMLTDEDKADVIANIDKYSLEEIEAKLSVICFHKKISFAQPEDTSGPTTYTFSGDMGFDDNTPPWVRACMETQKKQTT